MHVPHFVSEFIDTWWLWWHADEPITTQPLWGHPIFVWARCGKVLELVGASIALYEIWATSAARLAEGTAPSVTWDSWKEACSEVRESFRLGPRKAAKLYLITAAVWLIVFFVAWLYTAASGFLSILGLFFESLGLVLVLDILLIVLMTGFGALARIVAYVGARKSLVIVLGFVFICVGLIFDLLGT